MGHFAKVVGTTVTRVIVAEPSDMETFIDDSPGKWIQTSYNTRQGVHILGGTPLRGNYAAVGYTYDEELDAFIPPKRYPSDILDVETFSWKHPVEQPTTPPSEGKYWMWNEETVSWVEGERLN